MCIENKETVIGFSHYKIYTYKFCLMSRKYVYNNYMYMHAIAHVQCT